MGDSVTQGSAGDFTWRYRLERHLLAAGAEVDFVGSRSDLFDNVSGVFGSYDYAEPDFDRDHAARWGMALAFPDSTTTSLVTAHQPDAIVELLGINDLTWLQGDPTAVNTLVSSLVTDARAVNPSVDIILGELGQTWFANVATYNSLLHSLADQLSTADSRVVVAPIADGFLSHEHTYDPAHPNAAGEVRIAAAVADALAEIGIGSPYPRPLPTVPIGPRTPPLVTALAGDTEVTLTWQGPPGADHECVWQRDLTDATEWTKRLSQVTGGAAVIPSLVNGHHYEFRLQPGKGWADAEADAWSDAVAVTPVDPLPATPGGLTALPVDHGVSLTWSVVPRARNYLVWYQNLTDGGGWMTTEAADSNHVIGDLVAGARYDIAVQAVNTGGASGLSTSVSATPAGPTPPAPANLQGSATSSTTARVLWRPSTDATEYVIRLRDLTSGSGWNPPGDLEATPNPALNLAGLTPGHRYRLAIRADHQDVTGGQAEITVGLPRYPVLGVTASSPRRDRVRTRGRIVTSAQSYQLWTSPARRCGLTPPTTWDRQRASLPRAAFRSTAPAVWIRWYAVRHGRTGGIAESSTVCSRAK